MNDARKLITQPGDENCPADTLMGDYRRVAEMLVYEDNGDLMVSHRRDIHNMIEYPENIFLEQGVLDYWKSHADLKEREGEQINLYWDEIPEENLPPLQIRVRRTDNKAADGSRLYRLIFLKEFGEDKLRIGTKARKGKNVQGQLMLIKMPDIPIKGYKSEIDEGKRR